MNIFLVDTHGRKLPVGDAERYLELRRLLRDKQLNREVLLVYRGESLASLSAALINPLRVEEMAEVHRRVFYFGVKSRRFLENATGEHDARDFLQSINDVSSDVFEYLFDRIGSVLRHPKQGVLSGQMCSAWFRAYFEDARNRGAFVAAVTGLPEEGRLAVRDHYLFFLHTCGRAGMHEGTPLVSTSIETRIAREFAISR